MDKYADRFNKYALRGVKNGQKKRCRPEKDSNLHLFCCVIFTIFGGFLLATQSLQSLREPFGVLGRACKGRIERLPT